LSEQHGCCSKVCALNEVLVDALHYCAAAEGGMR
jgi:hypothetical protein